MAHALPPLSPLWRNSLRTWLAATLTIGIMLWAGRGSVMLLGLMMAVLFINDNELTPLRSSGQLVAAALVGILTATVLQQISQGWLVTAIGLLITGALVRGLGLIKGLGMGYMGCWSLEVIGTGKHFNWALIFDLALAVVVGIAMAELATWAFWPRRPLQQLPALEQGLCVQLSQQMLRIEQWLEQGGSPPQPLRSQGLLPPILQLQQLRDQRQGTPTPRRVRQLSSRWAQTGSIWRQLLRQWLLLEPLLLEVSAPLEPTSVLRTSLRNLELQLQTEATSGPFTPQPPLQEWLQEAHRSATAAPLTLAIAQQVEQLQQLLHSRALVRAAIDGQRSAQG